MPRPPCRRVVVIVSMRAFFEATSLAIAASSPSLLSRATSAMARSVDSLGLRRPRRARNSRSSCA
eukprot:3780720-Pyramimonas_sp.AAC.1